MGMSQKNPVWPLRSARGVFAVQLREMHLWLGSNTAEVKDLPQLTQVHIHQIYQSKFRNISWLLAVISVIKIVLQKFSLQKNSFLLLSRQFSAAIHNRWFDRYGQLTVG